MPLKGSKTAENLQAAFACESQSTARYLYFARHAAGPGDAELAAMLAATAAKGTARTHDLLDLLRDVPVPVCAAAQGGEAAQISSAILCVINRLIEMYCGMARTARDEGFDEIAQWFETLAKADHAQAMRLARSSRSCPSHSCPSE